MKFKISLTIDEEANNKVGLINSFSKSLEDYFIVKNYGSSIDEILIGLTCVNIPVGFEHLFKIYKPLYVDYKTITNQHTGEQIELKKYFNYSIRLNKESYNEFVNRSDDDGKKILSQLFVDSLSNLDALPKKVKDFNKEKFKNDIVEFLEKYAG
ncbi:MAG: hypothetical protein HC854_01280 [Flavobacterium sp.]|nr:hypothetical protein [Flavobacterium sp.]